MISIKHFLDQHRSGPVPDRDAFEALRKMGRLLLDGIATHVDFGQETELTDLRLALRRLAGQIEAPKSATGLLTSSREAVEALETYCGQTTDHFRQEKEQMRAMVALLSDTLADVSGQADTSGAHLHAIEKELELASGLNDMVAVRSNLESCLLALREAIVQQRTNSDATTARMSRALQDRLEKVQKETLNYGKPVLVGQAEIDSFSQQSDNPVEPPSSYVAAFKLQEHFSSRFGEAAKHQMLSTLGTELRAVLGPDDRLLRWKGGSFVMFISATATISGIRGRLSEAIAKIEMQYVEVGRRSALLAAGVDWTAFPQSDGAPLEAAFAEVEAFLADKKNKNSLPVSVQR